MNAYSPEFRESIVQRLLPPKNESMNSIFKETGLSTSTLSKWKRQAMAKGGVAINKDEQKMSLSSKDKFMIVLETAQLNEIELAEYCRHKGLYAEEVKLWQDACAQANDGLAKATSQLHKELRNKDQELRKLQKDLARKEAALAETAALLVLRKKANAIWGDGGDA